MTEDSTQMGGLQIFSVKGQIANILGFVNEMPTVSITRLCHCGVEAAVDNMQNELVQFDFNKIL